MTIRKYGIILPSENLLSELFWMLPTLFALNVLIYLSIKALRLYSNLRSAVTFDMTAKTTNGPVKIEIASKLNNENNNILSGPIKYEVMPQAIAEMLTKMILSGRCIQPTLAFTPSPSALALV